MLLQVSASVNDSSRLNFYEKQRLSEKYKVIGIITTNKDGRKVGKTEEKVQII